MKEKIKITYEELGKALFTFIYKVAWDYFNDKKLLKELALENKDKRYVLEATTALFYLTIIKLEGFLGNENLEKKVFDSMHEALYKGLGLDEKKSKEMKRYFIKRYAEYQDAMKEKKGPNWLWPLMHHILNNLKNGETNDAFAIMNLTIFFMEAIEQIHNLISEYEVV